MRRCAAIIALIGCLLLVGVHPTVHAQTDPAASPTISLLTQNIDNFPALTMDVRVTDDRAPQIGLTASNFTISEPLRDFTVISQRTQSLSLAVIVDLNLGADVTLIRQTLQAFFDTYYRG